MRKPSIRTVAIVSMSVAAFGCTSDRDEDEPREITAPAALEAANANLRSLMTGPARAFSFADRSKLFDGVISRGASCEKAPSPGGEGESAACPSLDLEPDADEAASDVADRILSMQNVETTETSRIVIRLDPEDLCKGDKSSDAAAPAPAPEPDSKADCIRALTEVPIRLELTSRRENDVDVALLVGESRKNPATLGLHQDELSLEVDLGALKAALVELLDAMDADTDALPETAEGRLRLAVTKNADEDFTITFSILEAVHLASTGKNAYDIQLAAASPAAKLRIDGPGQSLSGGLSFGSARLAIALAAIASDDCASSQGGGDCETKPAPEGTLAFFLAGLTGATEMHAGDESLTITGFGIGPEAFTLTLDGAPLIGLDLNADAGRKLDLTLAAIEGLEDALSLKVSPKLDLAASLHLANAGDKLDDVASWMLDEDLGLRLDGAAEPELVLFGDDASEDGSGAVHQVAKIAAGTLTLSSRAANTTVVVDAGMCLIGDEDAGDGVNPISIFESGACQ